MADDYERLDEEQEGGPVKGFLEHLEDLRWVLIKSAAAFAVGALLCLIAGNYAMEVLKWPLSKAKVRHSGTNQIVAVRFGTQRAGTYTLSPEQEQLLALGTNRIVAAQITATVVGTNRVLSLLPDLDPQAIEEAQRLHIELINLSPAGGFVVALQVSFYGGMVIASPFIFYFVVSFIFPALKRGERKYVYRGLAYGGGLFIAGLTFCYFFLMPLALSASQLYSQWLGLGAYQWKAEDYISFTCKFMIGMGLGFQLPVVLLTLVKIGVLNYRALRRMWRYMIVITLVLGALLTTPEVITQVMMAVPLYLLYEFSVMMAWYWEQPDRAKARKRLIIVITSIVLGIVLLWVAVKYGWPWYQQNREHQAAVIRDV